MISTKKITRVRIRSRKIHLSQTSKLTMTQVLVCAVLLLLMLIKCCNFFNWDPRLLKDKSGFFSLFALQPVSLDMSNMETVLQFSLYVNCANRKKNYSNTSGKMSLWPSDTTTHLKILTNNGWLVGLDLFNDDTCPSGHIRRPIGSGLMPDSTKPLLKPMLTDKLDPQEHVSSNFSFKSPRPKRVDGKEQW